MVIITFFLIVRLITSMVEPTPPFQYDHLILVQSWPFGFCTTTVCKQLTADQLESFTIHGLWPVSTNSFMESCNDHEQKLDYISLGETVNKYLLMLWPALSAKFDTNEDFWDREWNQRGSCTNMTHQNYFLYTINLREKIDLRRVLEENGIQVGGSYEISAIKDAIRRNNFIGGEDKVVLQCVLINKVYILTEVFLCVGEQGNFVTCNRHVRTLENCGITNVEFLEALLPNDTGQLMTSSSAEVLKSWTADWTYICLVLVFLVAHVSFCCLGYVC